MALTFLLILFLGIAITSSGARHAATVHNIHESGLVQGDGEERSPNGPSQPKRRSTALQPQRDSDVNRRQPRVQEEENGVDDVLAALVTYSRDPALWRFVHSVVEELDYSQHARSRAPGRRHHLPTLHVSRTHGHWWRATPAERNEAAKKWQNGSQPNKSSSADDEGGGSDKGEVRGVGSTARPHLQQTQPLPGEQIEGADGEQQQQAFFNGSSDIAPSTDQDDRNLSTHLPHFLFHKVYIDTTYDSHTRQPYHRPVLAVSAISNGKSRSTTATKDESDEPDSISTMTYQLANDGTREFSDKLGILSVTQKDMSEFSGEDMGLVKDIEESNTDEDLPEMWQKVRHRNNHRHRAAYKARKLHTFKSQMKFLQRWEEKLWRQSQHRSAQQLPRLT